MMQYRPLIPRPKSVQACRLNWPLNPFCNFLDLPLSSSVAFSHLKRAAPQPFTHRHQRAGSSQMACPLLHIAVGQVLFLSLTVWLSFTKPRRSPVAQGRTHTHTHTLVPSWRVPLWDPGHLLQLLSEPWCHYEETQCLFITTTPIDKNTHNPYHCTHTHTHVYDSHAGELHCKQADLF